jgi:hypothetical protein
MRTWQLALLGIVACQSSKPAPPTVGFDTDAGIGAGSTSSSSSSGGEEEQGVPEEEPLPECIVTSIGIWDDFEGPAEGTQLTGSGIGFDPVHHCGAQGLVATIDSAGQRSVFVRSVPAPETPTKAVSWSFLVRFEHAPDVSFRFAELRLANNRRLIVEFNEGSLFLLEKDDADAGTEIAHALAQNAVLNDWLRVDLRIDYATKKTTYKVGPPAGSAPVQELALTNELDRVTVEELGPTPPSTGRVTVRYDRAAIYVE